MSKERSAHRKLLAYLRHELCAPINGMLGYSDLLLEDLAAQPASTWFQDLQKIRCCSEELLTLVAAILDPEKLEGSQIQGDLSQFGATLRMELITPLSTVIGYCEMMLEEAPAALISDIDKLNKSAQQLLGQVNNIVNLAQQQLQIIEEGEDTLWLSPVQSLEGEAATTLAHSVEAALESLSQEASDRAASKSGTIMVIDDNPANCDLLARRLQKQGHSVATATNAQQALRLLQAIPYDLILLDVIMPGMNGLELLKQLKENRMWRYIPVIMISALDELDGAVKCIELGAEDYLQKPFSPTLLRARISASLERKQLRDQEILYLSQVDQLTTAAAAIEMNQFDPDTLEGLSQHPNKLGQLSRVFQQMAREVQSREQQLEQQVELLKVSIDSDRKEKMVAEIAATDHFQQLKKRTQGNRLDVENLYRPSLYPSLSSFLEESSQSVAVQNVPAPSIPARLDPSIPAKIVAVHSFRGGTGKSNITANLAVNLAKQGKRVGIIDTDLQSPGIHVLFGLDDAAIGRTVNDYLWNECALYEATHNLSSVLPDTALAAGGAIHLIPASTRANDITRILQTEYDKKRLLDGLQTIADELQLDVLLIDTHPGISEETLQAIAVCSLLIVILRPDYQDYQGTSVIVELARMLSDGEMMLLVNKALPGFEVEAYREQLETVYDVPVVDVLPFSEEMMNLASSEIFSMRYPNHPLSKAVEAVGQKILGKSSKRI
ncbi:MAG: response regulator [Phormidesmis sp.]